MSQRRHCPQTFDMGDPLVFVGNCLSDICLVLDEIRHDLHDIQSQLHQREDLESRLRFLECLMNSTIMGEGDTDEPSPF